MTQTEGQQTVNVHMQHMFIKIIIYWLFLLNQMSFLLLDQTYIYLRIHKNTSSSIGSNNPQLKLPSEQECLSLRKDQTQKQSQSPMEERKTNGTIKENMVLLQTIMEGYSIVLDVRIDKRRDAYMRLRIITSNGTSLMINNTRSLAMFSLKINQLLSCFKQWLVTISINMYNGQVIFKLPICNYARNEEIAKTQTVTQMLYKCYVQHFIQLIIFIIKESKSYGATAYDNVSKVKTLENVYRYSQMMHIRSHLNESRLQMQQEKSQKMAKRREDILNICRWSGNEAETFKVANQLFQMRTSMGSLVPRCEKDYQLNHEEIKYIRMLLAMPIQTKPKNPFQNLMVLNHILVHNIQSLRLNKVNSGGFSDIYLTDMQYLYVYSAQDNQLMHPQQSQSKNSCKMLHKYVIIKREEGNKTNRSHHQVQILKKIKNGCSIFLPKYYIVINKQNPYADGVFMDFIPSKNLKEYLIMGHNSISLLTKLYLIFSIVQVLRYIRDYRIVHLDIKPNNIMIYCNMLVKLIDFGQSYHPLLPRNKPGYTIPYSPPQIFNHPPSFTSKSDVFSLGVLIFEMLYGTYPFDFFQLTKSVQTAMGDYLQKWYMAPQETQTYGEGAVMRILNGIISKCLAVSPQARPQLDWIGVIIKHCFELLH